MPNPEGVPSGEPDRGREVGRTGEWVGVNVDLPRLVAAAADLCRKPLRHAVVPLDGDGLDLCVRIEARDPSGERLPAEDLELELYPSGGDLHLTLAWASLPERPILWHGGHPVWMEGSSGLRCERPAEGPPLEALARRLRALLSPDR